MSKLAFWAFERIMLFDLSKKKEPCIEIEFSIDNFSEYNSCYMGKMKCKHTGKDWYWYGLVADGSQAYEFYSFEEFITAKIFHGNNLQDIWNSVSLLSIDACDVGERLPFYLKT